MQYQYINSNDIYFPNCWQNISNTNEYNTGAQFAGARFAGAQFAAKGPNLPPRGPICRQGAQSAGAQFAGAQSAAKGPNLPGPNLPKNGKLGPKKCGAQFAAKSARGPICRGPICWGLICLEVRKDIPFKGKFNRILSTNSSPVPTYCPLIGVVVWDP